MRDGGAGVGCERATGREGGGRLGGGEVEVRGAFELMGLAGCIAQAEVS